MTNDPSPDSTGHLFDVGPVLEVDAVLAVYAAARRVVATWSDPLDDDVHGTAVAALDRALAEHRSHQGRPS